MKLRKAKFIVTVLILFILPVLASCEHHTIDKGVIVDKSMTPLYFSYIYANKTMVPVVHPPRFYLTVRDRGITETFGVNQETYASFQIGDSIRL